MPVAGPIVVLEGPDGGGKSHLAGRFERLGYANVHLGAPERPAYEHWIAAVRDTEGPTVFDRLHVGSYAYGHAFRGMDDLTTHQRWLLDGALLAADALMVHVRPGDNTLDHVLMHDRPPQGAEAVHYEQLDKQREVRARYDRFAEERLTDLPIYTYARDRYVPGSRRPIGTDRSESVAEVVDGLLRGRDHPRVVTGDAPALGNNRTPRYVFVGDEPHGLTKARAFARRHKLDVYTFCRVWARAYGTEPTVFNSTSGQYLHTALRTAGLRLSDYLVVNATQPDESRLRDHLDPAAVPGRTWVALGANAARELEACDVPFRTVPHPQYVRRFHHRRGLIEYPEALLGTREWRTF